MSFGKNLQALREKAGLSQSGLARESGISVKTIQNWEIDRALPRLDALVKLAAALNVSLDAFTADMGSGLDGKVSGGQKKAKAKARPKKSK